MANDFERWVGLSTSELDLTLTRPFLACSFINLRMSECRPYTCGYPGQIIAYTR